MKKKIDTIIWDWNGTLLDDTSICLEGINRLLSRRSIPMLEIKRYREIFTFPVKDYYKAAGFDFSNEAFEIPAEEFITEYNELLPGVELFPDARTVLEKFQAAGIRQFVLSAMEHLALDKSLSDKGIRQFFSDIFGIADNFAVSKLDRGRELLNRHAPDRESVIMVGDTLHDIEVASALGLEIIIIARGHQSRERFIGQDCLILDSLEQLSAEIF